MKNKAIRPCVIYNHLAQEVVAHLETGDTWEELPDGQGVAILRRATRETEVVGVNYAG